jgi:hypothetical protein
MDRKQIVVLRENKEGDSRISDGISCVWQMTLDCWSFKEKLNAEPRLQRHFVVLKPARG